MKKLTLYLETSVFGFCFDEFEYNRTKKEMTEELFSQLANNQLNGYISDIVLQEIDKTPDLKLKQNILDLIKKINLPIIEVDESEVSNLTNLYLSERVIPLKYENDAIHMAIATVSEVDVLVTWNCKHLANEIKIREIKSVNLKEGYTKGIDIRTPEEVIIYDE